MKIPLPVLIGAALLAWNTQANAAIISKPPNNVGGTAITSQREADQFSLVGPATIESIRFWWAPNPGRPLSDFSGTITYAFYQDSAGDVGSLLGSGTFAGLLSTATGNFFSVCGGSPSCPVQQVDLTLASSISLAAGIYWLELHEGATVSAIDGTQTFWANSANSGGRSRGCVLPCASGFDFVFLRQFAYELNAPDTGVPEPSSLALAGAGLACVLLRRRR